MKKGEPVPVDILAGYRRIALNANSRLGWRILLATAPIADGNDAIKTGLAEQAELVDVLPPQYVAHHGEIARLVGLG